MKHLYRLVAAMIVAAVVGTALVAAPAQAVVTRDIRVHANAGDWAYEGAKKRDILAPQGTDAASKMRAADPGDRFNFTGQTEGLFKVTAWIDTAKIDDDDAADDAFGKDRLYDRRLHIKGTSRYVFCDRI